MQQISETFLRYPKHKTENILIFFLEFKKQYPYFGVLNFNTMGKYVNHFFNYSQEYQFLSQGGSFAYEIYIEYLNCLSDESMSRAEYILNLKNKIDKLPTSINPEYELYQLSLGSIELDYDFAKGLNLYDIIDIDCFDNHESTADAIKFLCRNISFIVSKKEYLGKDLIQISFESCHCNYVDECIQHLKKQF